MNKVLYAKGIRTLVLMCMMMIMSITAHAKVPPAQQQQSRPVEEMVNDPFEPFNRQVYKFNTVVDKTLLKPAVQLYRDAIPIWGRDRVADFLRNLATPAMFVNTVLQGDGQQASITFWRFMLNSTYGLGGLYDFAGRYGLPNRFEDFGQTAGRYGIKSGPYLMLPLLGPSSVRDGAGTVVDLFFDPFNYFFSDEALIARNAVNTLETRSQNLSLTNEIDRTSLDPYATIRSLYLQSREDLVYNGTLSPEIDY